MKCQRCGMVARMLFNRKFGVTGEWMVCGHCARIVDGEMAKHAIIGVFIIAGLCAAAAFLSGCYTPPPAYDPWDGPGPMRLPSWTNQVPSEVTP